MVVTGAASGIGRAVALLYSERGWRVIAVDRDEAGLEQMRSDVRDGGKITLERCDLLQSTQIERLFFGLAERGVALDALVAAAGVASSRATTAAAGWDEIVGTNLRGTFMTCLGAIELMGVREGGSIVTFSSVLGRATLPGTAPYSASKAGIEGLTRALAIDHAAKGIRVNCILPGSTDTPMMWEGIPENELAGARALAASEQPLGRLAQPIEQARVAYFLTSDDAAFITGASVPVDGGLLAKLAATR